MLKIWFLCGLLCIANSLVLADDHFVNLTQISSEQIQEFFEKDSTSSILVCPEGMQLPLSFFLSGDLLELDSNDKHCHTLCVKRTFYLKLQGDQIFLSLDGTAWKIWDELLTGRISVFLDRHEDILHMQLGSEMNLR